MITNDGLPDPKEIARRVAAVEGDKGLDPDLPLGEGTLQDVFFALADDRIGGSAVVNLSRYSAHNKTLPNGQTVPVWTGGRYAHIGFYDPANAGWVFYPDYVKPEEGAALSKLFESQAEVGRGLRLAEIQNSPKSFFIDLRDPLTGEARRKLSTIVGTYGLAQVLIERYPLSFCGALTEYTEATRATLVLTPSLNGPGIGGYKNPSDKERHNPSQYSIQFEENLTVSYRGLKFYNNGRPLWGNRSIHIARRSGDVSGTWIPDLEKISPQEWGAISNAPRLLQSFYECNPAFDKEFGAVRRRNLSK